MMTYRPTLNRFNPSTEWANMGRQEIYFCDLTHTAQGISAPTFPLGVSYVLSYARQQLGSDFEFRLFKFPADLEQALRREPPLALCLSNYSWNSRLSHKIASLARGQ